MAQNINVVEVPIRTLRASNLYIIILCDIQEPYAIRCERSKQRDKQPPSCQYFWKGKDLRRYPDEDLSGQLFQAHFK